MRPAPVDLFFEVRRPHFLVGLILLVCLILLSASLICWSPHHLLVGLIYLLVSPSFACRPHFNVAASFLLVGLILDPTPPV